MILTSTDGQDGLPRYFASTFAMLAHLRHGQVDVVLPDGRTFRRKGDEPGPAVVIEVHNADLFARLVREGDLGFSDAYIDGWWSTPDLQAFMDLIHEAEDDLAYSFPGMGLVRAFERLRFWLQRNHKAQAKRNIAHHYDLGNDFYGHWLDDTMTYSSALFTTGQESLERAQIAKYENLVKQIGVKEGDHVLEIGCGWGGFAEYAAGVHGLRVTGLTISQAQYDFACDRIRRAGLEDRVEFRLQDYRDEKGTYDGVASIEMFEAVGEKYWPVYFDTLKARLKPGANAALQIITLRDDRWESYRRGVDFIQKHIFPGGMLPSPSVLRTQIQSSGLEVGPSVEFGQSYSLTLRRWLESFDEAWEKLARMGFDDRFRRMWRYYLTSCAAAFESAVCDVTQITVTRPVPVKG
ncbi:SAM-dependent methyltransferase [Chachezhania antarctica]|uniref:SAM-dependent methyltransferase n=1 Tax=Chachezhania antarctica TaxID=2340860 RepID=UPI000EAD7123|nr:cyclopropane-fatty-acyl-phospholipid synthase family protein [Chachezhania antarctica]|tara:strand:- start:666 stop:1886 length:1221 start_codon:yes stop_codon:yes gene_type:complete